MNRRVLITATSFARTSDRGRRMLEEAGCSLVFNPYGRPLTEEELLELVPEVDGSIAGVDPFTDKVMAAASNLRVIARRGVGYDNVDVEAATRRGIAVTITPGANDGAVAEMTIGLLLALARRIPQAAAALGTGRWERPLGIEVAGKTLGIVGFGRIGRKVAQKARGLEMHVIAYDPAWDAAVADQLGVAFADLDHLLATADFVTLHVPATPATVGLINADRLRRMKPTAYLINTSRGEVVPEPDLLRALTEGWIAGAALDVFAKEPPFGSPLLGLPNVLATPHLASQTHEAVLAMDIRAVDNLLAVLEGRRPPDLVNPEVWPPA